jgi:phenylacetate-CoA ligase
MLARLLSETLTRYSSHEQVEQSAQLRLKRLLRHALKHSTFYRKYYAEHGITFKDIDALRPDDLPFVTKEILMNNFDEVSSDPALNWRDVQRFTENNDDHRSWFKNRYKIIKSSGTSGRYGFFVYDRRAWNILRAMLIGRAAHARVNPLRRTKLAIVLDTKGLHAGISMMGNVPRAFYDLLIIDVHEPQDAISDKLNSFRPEILTGYANCILMCACEQLKGRLNIKPAQVGCSGEPLTDEGRNLIFRAFDAYPTNLYASSESVFIANSRRECQNLHVAFDWNLLEAIDDCGMKSQDEAVGNAVLTNLYAYAFPLIRYKMNDRISLHTNPCPVCGSVFPVITTIEGRAEEMLRFVRRDGSSESVCPPFITLFDEPGIKSFRIVQKQRNRLEIQLALFEVKSAEWMIQILGTRMNDLLAKKQLLNDVQYSFVLCDDIQADEKTGKVTRIVPFVAQDNRE